MIKLLLEIIPRIIVLVSLQDLARGISSFANSDIAYMLQQNPIEVSALLVSLIAFFVAIATPKPMMYIVSAVALSIATRFSSPLISLQTFLILGILAVADHVKSVYRENQEKFVVIDRKDVVIAILLVAAITVVFIAIPFIMHNYIHNLLATAISLKASNSFIEALTSNPIFILVLTLAIGAVIYEVVAILPEVIIVYLEGPRNVAISVLKNRNDIDMYLVTPFTTIKSIALSLVFVPPIYGALDIAILSYVTTLLRLSPLYTTLVRGVIIFTVLTVVSYIIYRIDRRLELDVKSLAIASVIVLALVYISGVIYSLNCYGNTAEALTRPSIGSILEGAIHIYTTFYSDMFLFIESLLRLFGVAP